MVSFFSWILLSHPFLVSSLLLCLYCQFVSDSEERQGYVRHYDLQVNYQIKAWLQVKSINFIFYI